MTEVLCGVKAFDIHELYCHFLARELGYYADEGITVRVVDATHIPDDRLPRRNYFQVACGAAYLGRRAGFPFKVLFAATEKPMFWLHSRHDITSIDQLRGSRVATFPSVAPPHWFHRILLRNHGIDPDRDIDFLPCRDDIVRLGLLRQGDVDAALISSATSPILVQAHGLNTLALAGDEFSFVTAGVATFESVLTEQPDLIGAVVRAHRRGLEAIHDRVDEATAVLADVLSVPDDVASKTFALAQRCYTSTGWVASEMLAGAVGRMGEELPDNGKNAVDPRELYDFGILGADHA